MSTEKKILVLNCGSSSLKFALIDSNSGEVSLSGLAERLGNPDASITIKQDGNKAKIRPGATTRLTLGAINQLVASTRCNKTSLKMYTQLATEWFTAENLLLVRCTHR